MQPARSKASPFWECPKIRVTLVCSPDTKDPTIQGTILGDLNFGNSLFEPFWMLQCLSQSRDFWVVWKVRFWKFAIVPGRCGRCKPMMVGVACVFVCVCTSASVCTDGCNRHCGYCYYCRYTMSCCDDLSFEMYFWQHAKIVITIILFIIEIACWFLRVAVFINNITLIAIMIYDGGTIATTVISHKLHNARCTFQCSKCVQV